MTVGVALVVPGKGAVIACDGRVSGESGNILNDLDEKWLIGQGSYVATCAGMIGGLWFDLRKRPPKTVAQLRRKTMDLEAIDHDRNYELLVYDMRSQTVLHSDHQGDTQPHSGSLAIGCGAPYALGLIDAAPAPRTLAAAERTARAAVASACKRHSACGGRVRVILVEGKRARLL